VRTPDPGGPQMSHHIKGETGKAAPTKKAAAAKPATKKK
jgi:hypothetical protein